MDPAVVTSPSFRATHPTPRRMLSSFCRGSGGASASNRMGALSARRSAPPIKRWRRSRGGGTGGGPKSVRPVGWEGPDGGGFKGLLSIHPIHHHTPKTLIDPRWLDQRIHQPDRSGCPPMSGRVATRWPLFFGQANSQGSLSPAHPTAGPGPERHKIKHGSKT